MSERGEPMKKLFLLCIALSLSMPAFGHDAAVSKETLKKLFSGAENFVNRKKALTAQQISKVEQDSGDLVQEADKNLNVFVAVAKDPDSGKMRSIGAVLMVDAKGSTGTVDMLVAYNLDGSVRKVMITSNKDDKALESEAFLSQMEGKGPSDSWDPDRDFELAGNTASAKALIRAVYRGMHLFLAFMS